MELYKAQVVDNEDLLEEGKLVVYCDAVSEDLIRVNYVSPYFSQGEAGFIAIPEIGTEIIISQVENDPNIWYYLGSIVRRNPEKDEGSAMIDDSTRKIALPERTYRARTRPQKYSLTSPMGHKLVLSDDYNPQYVHSKALLESAKGKRLLLADSPNMDTILLENEDRDGIKITSKGCKVFPGRSVLVTSRGDQTFVSKESEITLRILDGQDITIENTSTGFNSIPGEENKTGNVNLRSRHRDVNLEAKEGRIFLDSKDLIQIEITEGGLVISSAGKVSINSGGEIHMKAEGDIRLQSNSGNIDLKAATAISIDAGNQTSILGGSNVSVEGGKIFLNDSIAEDAKASSPDDPTDNNYGN